MKVHETRSQTASAEKHERKAGARTKGHDEPPSSKSKKAKVSDNGATAKDFDEFCKAAEEHLSVQDMRRILEFNGQDSSGSDEDVIARCQDMMFYGPLEKCPLCKGPMECNGSSYICRGFYTEWTSCPYSTTDSMRKKDQTIKVPKGIGDSAVADWVKKQESRKIPERQLTAQDKPLSGYMVSLSGRLSNTHQSWREEIERHGGKVNGSVLGVNCLVVSPTERERGGSSKVVEAMERNIPVVSENWLIESIEKKQAQPLDAYDVVSDLAPDGRGIPWSKMDPSEEAIESLAAEVKLYGKRAVYKDFKFAEEGGSIFEKDGIIYNCAFSLCDLTRRLNEYCIMQLIMVPDNRLHLYYKRGQVGADPRADERVEEWPSVDDAIKEFVRLFEELTGNEFEPWEREKKFEKKPLKFFPIDMDEGVDARHGGLGLRQLGIAAAHSKLDSTVANFVKVLCSQEIYRYALMEMGMDSPDLPIGMVTDLHLKRCEEALLEFREKLKTPPKWDVEAKAMWLDFSNKWFSLMHSTRPFTFRDVEELADHAVAPLEGVRDITVASHIIGDMTGSTIDDPLSDRYKKLGCTITPVDKDSEDYKMIQKYLMTTYEPVKLGDVIYGVTLENVFAVESSASPSYEELKKLPNKVLLWCGTRSSNLLRHLQKGFLPFICQLPVPGYMFGKAIVCSDASAEAARYGYTAVDRPEGFLILGLASLGKEITEVSSIPEDTKQWEKKKIGVKFLGRKKTDESEHFTWKDDIKVPCGKLVPSDHKDSLLEFNEYAVYDPKQVTIKFLVGVKYEELNMEVDTTE